MTHLFTENAESRMRGWPQSRRKKFRVFQAFPEP